MKPAQVKILAATGTSALLILCVWWMLPSRKAPNAVNPSDPSQMSFKVSANERSPRNALFAIGHAMETGDEIAYTNGFIFASPEEEQFRPVMAQLVIRASRFKLILAKQFGVQDAIREFSRLPIGIIPAFMLDQAREQINGDSATVALSAGNWNRTIPMERVDGKWKLTVEQYFGVDIDRLKQMPRLVSALQVTSDELEKGSYRTPQDAVSAVKTKIR